MDAKKSDHAYPKHVKCFSWGHNSEKLFSSPVILAGEQCRTVKPKLFIHNCVPDPVYNCSDICLKSVGTDSYYHDRKEEVSVPKANKRECLADIPMSRQDTLVNEHSRKGHTYFNFSQNRSASVAPVFLRLERFDSYPMKQKQTKAGKPKIRETDHMYNTRKSETVDNEVSTSKDHGKVAGHVRDARKAESTQETTSRKPNNRDTDHLYNMRNAETLSQEKIRSSARVLDRRKRKRGLADMRVVDNDHMYHDKIKKKRNKLDNKGRTTRSKSQSPGNTVTAVASKEKSHALQSLPENLRKDQVCAGSLTQKTCVGDIVQPANHRKTQSRNCTFETKSNLVPTALLNVESECEEKVCSVFMGDEIRDPLSEHAYTSVQSKRSGVLDATSPVTVSTGTTTRCRCPAISDDDSDHISEDSTNRTGIFQTDHMYVHADYLGNDGLCEAEGPVLTKCFSVDGYRQEHSYASSSEIHYDACVNCSELVQHLIGTIRQQRGHINDLEQKLQIANARNKNLSMMFSQQLEDIN